MALRIPEATRAQLLAALMRRQADARAAPPAAPQPAAAAPAGGARASCVAYEAPGGNLFPGLVSVRSILCAGDGGASLVGTRVKVGGWVRTGRKQGNKFCFLSLNDGSTPHSLQVVVDANAGAGESAPPPYKIGEIVQTGTCLVIEGEVVDAPADHKDVQKVELRCSLGGVVHRGGCEANTYPMSKKRHTMEALREHMHLRPRTGLIGCVARCRDALAFATHSFFHSRHFLYVHTPLITASDCEGAGEMFQVTKLLDAAEERTRAEAAAGGQEGGEDPMARLVALRARVAEQGQRVKAAKEARKAGREGADVEAEVKLLLELKERLGRSEREGVSVGGLPRAVRGDDCSAVDYSRDFFSKRAFLTVSGQMNVETYCCALSNVYTFGPTFRAENSHTGRHLAEFWMIEPELAFADLRDDMDCAEAYVKYCCEYLLERCRDDLEFFVANVDARAIERVENVLAEPFARCSYTEGVAILERAVADGSRAFENEVFWGCDLASEHERYLAEEVFRRPTIVYDYPKEIKAFYMRLNDDGRTVAAMDILVPRVGELIGGSVREERLEVLEAKIADGGLEPEDYAWYVDLRRYGTVPHAGFGLGFERLIMFCTGVDNIRDVIPFPRWQGNAAF